MSWHMAIGWHMSSSRLGRLPTDDDDVGGDDDDDYDKVSTNLIIFSDWENSLVTRI